MKKRISAVLLAALLGATCLASCGGDNGSSKPSGPKSEYVDGGTFTDEGEHYVDASKLTHDVKVTPSDRVFVQNGASEYVVVLGTNDSRATDAVTFLRQQVEKATGATLKMVIDSDQDLQVDGDDSVNGKLEFTPNTKYLVLDHQGLESEAGIEWRTDIDLAYSGYMIQSAGDCVFMKTNSFYGYQKVAQAFLREVLGYEWYSYDTILYTKDGATLPDMDIVEKPDFDLTWNSGKMESSNYMASPLTKEEVFAFINGKFCHNSFDYIPTSYYETNPDWFAWEASLPLKQLCYTAHGNKASYDAMIDLAVEGVMTTLDNNPSAAAITFTNEDLYGDCICTACTMIKELFYDSHAATYMFFVNDVDTKVHYPQD